MKRNQTILFTIPFFILFFLLMACKKNDPYAVSGSIYGTYISSANGTYGSSGSSFGWAASIIKVAPINSTYIKITFPGFAGLDQPMIV